MATLQVRSIDPRLYDALRARARAENRSVSQEVVAILKGYLSGSRVNEENATEAFLGLADSWHDERSGAEIVEDIRRSRSTRRFRKGPGDVFD